jgi:hypothetical protein
VKAPPGFRRRFSLRGGSGFHPIARKLPQIFLIHPSVCHPNALEQARRTRVSRMVSKSVLNRGGGKELSEKALRLLAVHDREVNGLKDGAAKLKAA